MDISRHILQFMYDYNYFERNQPPAPHVKEVIIDVDRITFHLAEIPRISFADGTRRPIINEYKIEWKEHRRSRWNTICTNTDNLNGFTFFLKDNKFKDYPNGLVNNHWYEQSFFKNFDDFYDIRVYAENKSEKNKEYYTYVKLRLLLNTPFNDFEDYCNTPPDIVNAMSVYLIGPNPKNTWKGHENDIAQLTSIRPMTWTYFKPREGWKINNYLFSNNKWIDLSSISSMQTLIKKNQSNDIICEIFEIAHLNRFCGDTRQEKIFNLKKFIYLHFQENIETNEMDIE